MNDLLNVSASPHVRSKDSTSSIMRDVAIALLPATAFGIYNFGVKALFVVLTAIISCVLTEYVYQKLMKKSITINDYSAVVTGLLLGLNLPSTLPLWIAFLGGVFAILIVKQLFGGLGQNFMNPALGARCFLLISFAGRMTSFTYDGVTGATPLAVLKEGDKAASVVSVLSASGTSISDMFFGTIAGTIGETSVIAILLGAVYLLVKKIINWKIPFIYIGTFAVFVVLFGGKGLDMNYLAAQLCGGGLMLGAFFMATDYVTSPITPMGQIAYGILLGCFTGIFRMFGASAEGVSYAIIFCNLLVPLIEKFTIPVPFGREGLKDGK
ncbi:RnfABCDGE type electron transport complex subunit D [Anaeromicropila populeti]|uniref:Ion-translocating oxidoreductase complex subunit D n=1 Tax=Anaeromicropila populeti TaxID=37658 RepID=A0A1I6I9G4_9FIRM|nr:RnfABCDGE type electron transport complex subunit D [Anaeromicropila populeti]SFR63397.1 electron transport complex protein RnfD [Anaeromicropila populeti]